MNKDKVRDVISQLRTATNSITPDVRKTNQFLNSVLVNTTNLILKREVETRKIYRSIEIFKPIDCINLEPVPTSSCGVFIPNCNTIMKSTIKIPKAYQSSTGYIIMVYAIDRSVQFHQITPSDYINTRKRQYKGKQKYFWIIDDYLYIPDSSIGIVTALGLFIDNSQVDAINHPEIKCHKFMDSESSIPDWLRKDVIDTATNIIAGVTLRIPQDVNPNLNAAR